MSEHPDPPNDPFAHLPPELRAMLEQLGGPEALEQAQAQFAQLFGGSLPGFGFQPPARPSGPVDWDLATRVALQVAAEGDRSATDTEATRIRGAFELAEHWLDQTPLPSAAEVGRVVAASRQTWVNAAVASLKPLVEPVARAATDAMIDLAREQLGQLQGEGGLDDLEGLLGGVGLPDALRPMLEQLLGSDPGELLRPAGAGLAGLQAGQVIGQLARQLIGQYDLGIPTAPREQAHHLVVNVADDLAGYGLEDDEVRLVLALHEAAHRRLYHAVPWLEAHVASLVARFAAGTVVDADRMREVAEELTLGLDPEDEEALAAAMERAASFRLTPTEEQQRVLGRLQAVVCLVGAWARHEVARAVEGRLPSFERIQEVLRRRRVARGDGEQLLEALLGLDLKPADETVGERFVVAIEAALGPEGLHRALAHPENLPDGEELADPGRWLARTAGGEDIPDDLAALFAELGDAPHEDTADERLAAHEGGGGSAGTGGDATGDPDDPEDPDGRGAGGAGPA
ncbi:MAG: zinc-dependent metalloprotease [Nitriliruptoraceae bacterium]